MATGQQIVDRAQVVLLDSDAKSWSEAQLLKYVNEMQNDFAARTKGFVQEASIAVTVPTPEPPEYALPSLCVGLDKVDSGDWGPIRLDEATTAELDRFDSNWQVASAVSASTYVRDRRAPKTIRLYPRPNQPDTLLLRYFAKPVDVQLSTTSALPTWTHHWLQIGVESRASGDEGDMQDVVRSGHCSERYENAVKVTLEMLDAH